MRKLLRDPLVHFLLIGAAAFAVLSWLSTETNPQQVRLSAEQVRTVLRSQIPTGQNAPSRPELEMLIEPLIREEIYYREALALGLDTDDDQVRTRLIEKMRYVSEDLADPEPADESQLLEMFAADPARFAAPEAVTFEHRYFSPSQRGDTVLQDAETALAALRSGGEPSGTGDSTPLGEEFADATRDRLSILFGAQMTATLFTAEPDIWIGPLESDFGLHLVRVTARRALRQPSFEEVRQQVREAYAADQRAQRNAQAWAAMRERYEVTIEWPEEFEIAN
jgi:peptidyl-prolyl cis-trans isomerase C